MSEKIGTNQHYLPRVLMRQWGINPTPKTKIYIYSKKTKQPLQPTGIGPLCSEHGYYDSSDMARIADDEVSKFESEFGRLAKKLRNNQFKSLSCNDWIDLTVFCSLVYQRNESQRQSHANMTQNITDFVADAYRLGPRALTLDSSLIRDAYMDGLQGSSLLSHKITSHFTDRCPHLYLSPPGSGYLLGDNPVELVRSPYSTKQGLHDLETYIRMPITPFICLVLIHPKSRLQKDLPCQGGGLIMDIYQDEVDNINAYQIRLARKMVFYKQEHSNIFGRIND